MSSKQPNVRGLYLRPTAKGGERYVCSISHDGRQMMRGLGAKKSKIHPDGLTEKQAEKKLLALRIEAMGKGVDPTSPNRVTVEDVGKELIKARERDGRKKSTIESLDSELRIHLVPFFGTKPVGKIERDDVRRFMAEMEAKPARPGSKRPGKQSPKSVANALGVLHSVIELAISEGWARDNPVKLVKKPRVPERDADIHFLESEEVEALLRAVPNDDLGRVERVMYLAAAMTGMRQGELFALRWRDVDWTAGRVRVRRSFVSGEFGTPKSKRSSRAVPLHPRLAGELERLFQWRGEPEPLDDDLVFAHPATGKPIDRSKLYKRYKAAVRRAKVRDVRFHDLRHTFGTRMAAAGVPMRTLQEWMGHRDFATTLIYADYAPAAHEAEWVERAFATPTPSVEEEVRE